MNQNKIQEWDDKFCANHVVNLVNVISSHLLSYEYKDIILIDIGANVGKVFDLLSDKTNIVEAHLFEPSKILYNHMFAKYQNNPKVTVYNFAVGPFDQMVYLDETSMQYQINNNSKELNFGLSKIIDGHTENNTQCITISSFLNNNSYIYEKKCLIKIDTETVDYSILLDLLKIINNFKFKPLIEFENNYFVNNNPIEWAQNIVNQFEAVGYEKIIVERYMGDGILLPKK